VTRIRLCGHGCGQDGCGKGAHAVCQVRGQVDSTVGHGAQEVRISHSGSSSFTVSALNKPSSSFPSSSSSSGVSLPQERSTAEQVFYNLVARSRVCVRTRTRTHIHTHTHRASQRYAYTLRDSHFTHPSVAPPAHFEAGRISARAKPSLLP